MKLLNGGKGMFILKRFLGKEYDRINKIIDSYNNVSNNYINLEACEYYNTLMTTY